MPTALARPVQKFEPTTGPGMGYVALAVCALVVGIVVTNEQHVTGLRVALGAVLVAVLIWLTLLRPRATAYDDRLVLRGMVSDTTLPLSRIDSAVVRHMLVVRIEEDRYTCAGIARSTRSMVKPRDTGGRSVLGLRQIDDRVGSVGASRDVGPSRDYATFVETRIEDLASAARRDGKDGPDVSRRWARPELAVLLLSAAAFLLSLLLL